MRLSVAVAITLALVAGALAAMAPAVLVDAWLATATEGRARLADPGGTVWRGNGMLTDRSGALRLPVAWRLSPLALLRGSLDVDVAPQGAITLTSNAVTLRDLRADVPAAALAALRPGGLAAAFGGDLRVDAPAFRYDGKGGDGAVDLRWDRARVVVNGVLLDLGTVVARVTPRGADLVGTFTSNSGMLRTAGDAVATQDHVGVTATLTPVGTLPPEIALLVAMLGPADANGATRIVWRGALR